MSEIMTVFNAGKRAYTVNYQGNPKFRLEKGKSITVDVEYGKKLIAAYPRDLKDRDELGGASAKDAEIARLKAENEALKAGKPVNDGIVITDEIKDEIKEIKGLGEKSALKLFEEAEALTPEEQSEVLSAYVAQQGE